MENLHVNRKYYIHSLISVALMVLVRFLPPFGGLTPLGMEILGIFLGALWGWINIDMIWPSVLALTFLGFSAYSEGGVAAMITSAFSNSTTQLILWLFLISATLTTTGISAQLANRLVSWRVTRGRPWVLSIMIILACYICSMFASGFPAIFLCWSFVYSICEKLDIPKKSKWPNMMIVGIIFSSCVGGALMPFKQGTVATFGFLSAASDGLYENNFARFAVYGLIFGAAIMLLYFLLCRFLVRPDMSVFTSDIAIGEKKPFDQRQKIALALLGVMIVLMILPSCIPNTGVAAFLNTIGTNAIVLLLVCVAIFLRDRQGKPLFTFKELADKGVLWPMLFMVSTAMTVGTALASDATGVRDAFASLLMPLFEGRSPYFFACVYAIAALVITNFINNAVVGAVMIPIMYTISSSVGVNPLAMTALIAVTSNIGLILPCASPLGALLNGNKDWISQKAIVGQSCVAILATAIATVAVGVPIANLLMR